MRNLTITRQKSFVACLGTMKVYIEEHNAPDTIIQDTPCRMLGKLKNGETGTFSISDEAQRVFVIAGQTSKNFCCESYPIPEGTEDLHLTGKNRYNPAAGNPFRFDGNSDPTAMSTRKRTLRNGIIMLIVAAVVGLGVGILLNMGPADKTFTYREMSVTLNEDFFETEFLGYETVYRSQKAIVLVLKERVNEIPLEYRNVTLEEYGELMIESNDLPLSATVTTENGLTFFEYEASEDGDTFYYFAALYRTEDAFWTLQFYTKAENRNKLRDDFIDYAKSVSFAS